MAVVFRKSCSIVYFLFTLSLFVNISFGLVHELSKKNIEKFLKDKLFVLTFVDSPTCSRCRVLFPFFVAASQVFPHDPEIFFTRTHDPHLAQEWGITELPALIYHRLGVAKPELMDMNIDITVDDIIDEIAKILHGNFAGLTRTYCVHLTEKNYDEMVITPKQPVMLLIHDKKDEERLILEKVAYAFRKDDGVLFALLDISKHRTLRDERFMTKDVPVIMWLSAEEKKPKRFGGVYSLEMLVTFVNDMTGLNRDTTGAMQKTAGRIPEADEIMEENIDRILEGNDEDLKSIITALTALRETVDSQMLEMLEYYHFIMDTVALKGSASKVFSELLRNVESTLFGKEETSTKLQETLKRKKNILSFLRALEKRYSEDRKKKTREELQLKVEVEKRGKMKDDKHIHMHTEL